MPRFSQKSLMMLEECHPDIQKVMNEAIKYIDFSITEGARTEEQQLKYYASGKSKTMNSKHISEYVKEYIQNNLITDEDSELYGCVKVDEQFAYVLGMLMDKYTFADVEYSWVKLCYYYNFIGPVVSE